MANDSGLTKEELKTLKDQVSLLQRLSPENQTAIWLEVSEVRYETHPKGCSVVLKADRGEPKPAAWPVGEAEGEKPLDIYKSILNEMDKKRVVLARLTWDANASRLHCDALRFQSPEMGSR